MAADLGHFGFGGATTVNCFGKGIEPGARLRRDHQTEDWTRLLTQSRISNPEAESAGEGAAAAIIGDSTS